MSYLGSPPQFAQFPSKFFDGDGSAMTVTLDYAPPNLAALLVFIDGVRQNTNAYTLSGTSLTFTGTVASGTDNVQVVHLGQLAEIPTPGDDTVSTAKIQDDAVTAAKILADAVTTVKILDDNVTTAKILDNNVTLAKLDDGTQGDVLYYGASGAPARLGFGTSGYFLKTQGTGANPIWAEVATGTAWQSVVTGATLTAVAGKGYPINTTSNACTVTLPASASVGDTIEFMDYLRTWGTNAVTIDQNSLKYQGNATPKPIYEIDGESIKIVYADATQGWVPVRDGSVVFETPQVYDISYLVIGGGGGGGVGTLSPSVRAGGGGGAGGYRSSYGTESSGGGASTETPITGIAAGVVLTVTVGAGGAGGASSGAIGTVGVDTSLVGTGVSVTSAGGGYGADVPSIAGGPGGSGGGGGAVVGVTAGGSGTSNQGYDGGVGASNSGGAGGGASEIGGAANGGTERGGDGGAGITSYITGSAVGRGGGGGGGGYSGTSPASDGASGGSNVGSAAATANTGGGSGGDSHTSCGAGGSGVVILRMETQWYSTTTTGSPTVSTDGSYTVLTFNASGSYTT